ncbi:hypothetical protein VP01_1247g1, partial [Puccinia sorghi]
MGVVFISFFSTQIWEFFDSNKNQAKQKNRRRNYLHLQPEILHPSISKVLDIKSDGHCGFWVFSYCLGRGQHEHLAMRNKLYQNAKERSQWYKDHSYIDNISSVLKMKKFESSGPSGLGNWMSIPTFGDLISNTFKSP